MANLGLALPVSPTIPSLDCFKVKLKPEPPTYLMRKNPWVLAFPVKMFPSINSMIPLLFLPIFPTKTIPSWSKPAPFRAPGSPSSVLSVSWARPLGTGIGKLGQPREPWEINKNPWKLMEIDGVGISTKVGAWVGFMLVHRLNYYSILCYIYVPFIQGNETISRNDHQTIFGILIFCWQSFKIPCQSFFSPHKLQNLLLVMAISAVCSI